MRVERTTASTFMERATDMNRFYTAAILTMSCRATCIIRTTDTATATARGLDSLNTLRAER
jgi:hypothetical protein